MNRTTVVWALRLSSALVLGATLTAVALQDAAAGGATRNGDDKPESNKPDQPGKNAKGKGAKGKGGKGKQNKQPAGVGPFAKDEYPLQERLRPLVLPDGMGEITVGAGYSRTNVPIVGGTDTVGLAVDFDYGLGDKVELGVGSGMFFAPEVDWSNELTAHVHWLAYDSKEFDFAPGVVVPFQFYEDAPFGANVDLLGRYVLDERFFFQFGRSAIGLGVSPDFSLAVNLNGGVGWQVDKPWVVFLDTSLASLLLAPEVDVTGVWDRLDLSLGAQYTPTRTVDVGLQLGYGDAWQVKDEFVFSVTGYGKFRF